MRCEIAGAPQLEQLASDFNFKKSCARLVRVRAFECLRFGFGISTLLLTPLCFVQKFFKFRKRFCVTFLRTLTQIDI